jgi:hypothetical protein
MTRNTNRCHHLVPWWCAAAAAAAAAPFLLTIKEEFFGESRRMINGLRSDLQSHKNDDRLFFFLSLPSSLSCTNMAGSTHHASTGGEEFTISHL